MTDERTCAFVLAAEDRGHFDAVSRLTDRVISCEVEWFEGSEDRLRRWRGPSSDQPWYPLKNAFRLARALGLPTSGKFDGRSGEPEAAMIRAQLLLFKKQWNERRSPRPPFHAVFIARDTDRKPREPGIRQAIELGWPFPIVAAVCEPEVESWFVCAFIAENEGEQATLDELSKELGFSPVQNSHRLTAKRETDPKDAKRVLAVLSKGDRDREVRCLDLALTELETRGRTNNLTGFIKEIREHIVPLVRDGCP